MSQELHVIAQTTNTLLEFVTQTDEAGIPTSDVASYLVGTIWEKDVPTERAVQLIERDRQQPDESSSTTTSDRTPRRVDITDLELVSGYQFEHVLVELFSRIDGDAQATQQSSDQGIDAL